MADDQREDLVFNIALKTLRIILRYEDTSVFLVYAHENDSSPKNAAQEIAKQLIGWLNEVGSNLRSDQRPTGYDKGEFFRCSTGMVYRDNESVHDILENQLCLLLSHLHPRSVEKVIVCGSELLDDYLQSSSYQIYRKKIRSAFNEAGTDKLKVEEKLRQAVEEGLKKPQFHHVWTETAILEVLHSQSSTPQDSARIIPVVLNGNLYNVFPPALVCPTNVRIKLGETPTKRDLHEACFRLLRRLFEKQESVLKEIELAYQKCFNLPQQDMHMLELSAFEIFHQATVKNLREDLGSLSFGKFLKSFENLPAKIADIQQSVMGILSMEALLQRDRTMTKRHFLHALLPAGAHYIDHKDMNPNPVEGTCKWVLGHPAYTTWRDTMEKKVLWISAEAGCGKSVLCRMIIEKDLPEEAPNSLILYFFFKDTNDEQKNAHRALCSLLHQLMLQRPDLVDHARELFDNQGSNISQASFSQLWSVLITMVNDPKVGHVICLLDALDECQEDDRGKLISSIENFCTKAQYLSCQLRFIVTGRPYLDLQAAFADITSTSDGIRLDGAVESDAIKQEIDLVIHHEVESIRRKLKLPLTVRDYLQETLLKMESRTYLWLSLTLKSLPKRWPRTIEDMKKKISELPKGIHDAYESMLAKCDDQNYARKVLQIILAAYRPLTVGEVEVAFRISHRERSYQNLELEDSPGLCETLPARCGFVITIVDSKVYFIHQTVKEFLLRDSPLVEPQGTTQVIRCPNYRDWERSFVMEKIHHQLALACMRTLLLREFSEVINSYQALLESDERPWEAENRNYPQFVSYATFYWADHYRDGQVVEELAQALAQRLIQKNIVVKDQFGQVRGSAVQLAAAARIRQIFSFLQASISDINEISEGRYVTVLIAAAFGGDPTFVTALLAQGADVNAQGGHYGNALQAASVGGHLEVVKQLLAQGADVNAQGGDYGNALQAASARGHLEVVKQLLAQGADMNVQGGHYGNALQGASEEGHLEVVKQLLAQGADVNAQGGHYDNALQAASEEGHLEVVKLLLAQGADVNAQGGDYGNALQAASVEGHLEVVKLLLAQGADVNAQGGDYGNALQAASVGDHLEVVKLLLAQGADVNAQGGDYGNALQGASEEGHLEVVKLLLAQGADVNAQGGLYGNALQAASVEGHLEVIKLLLAQGADVNAQGGHYGNALQAASARGHLEVVKLLLAQGADMNAQGGLYDSTLQAASEEGHLEVIKLLLAQGADVNAQGGDYGNTLQAASVGGHLEVVKLLLAQGADVNAQGGRFENALQAASVGGHLEVVKLLLAQGADVNAQGGHYGNALQAASVEGHLEVVKQLLAQGADVNAQGGHYGNALQAASVEGHLEVVK